MPSTIITHEAKFLHPPGEEPGSTKESVNFGIYRMTIPQKPIQYKTVHWIFTIDRSGSMNDFCQDRKTKMDHLKHTLTNMFNYLIKLKKEHQAFQQFVTIIMFDHETEIVANNIEVDDTLGAENIKDLLAQIVPRGSTNIELALEKAADTIKKILTSSSYDNTQQTNHIFMSDGNVTMGNGNKAYLKEKLNLLPNLTPDYISTNTFIGFGSHHDAKLLQTLSDIPKGEYYFVDSIENAGMIYGEILYNGLYEYFNNITLKTEGCEIYNYEKDTWVSKLHVYALSSGQERTWHLRKKTVVMSEESTQDENKSENRATVDAYCTNAAKDFQEGFFRAVTYPESLDKEVEKYLWRQKTQEKMKKVDNFITEQQALEKPPSIFDHYKVPSNYYNRPHSGQRLYDIDDDDDDEWNLYPGAKRSKLSKLNVPVLSPPTLKHNYTISKLEETTNADTKNASSCAANTPLPSPVNKKKDKPGAEYLTEECEIIDLAEKGTWIMVMEMIDKVHSTLVNSFPENKNHALLHLAIEQENVKATEQLLVRGANPTVSTRDGKSCKDLLGKPSSITSGALKTLIEKYTTRFLEDDDSTEKTVAAEKTTRDDYLKELDEFMLEMKFYMSENNLDDDEFMKNLCDDIYVCIKSLNTKCHNISRMFLGVRSLSQGRERAYNINNFRDLENASNPISGHYRSLSSHSTSESKKTSYASQGAADVMRAVSE